MIHILQVFVTVATIAFGIVLGIGAAILLLIAGFLTLGRRIFVTFVQKLRQAVEAL